LAFKSQLPQEGATLSKGEEKNLNDLVSKIEQSLN
jgi:hypothetical protein